MSGFSVYGGPTNPFLKLSRDPSALFNQLLGFAGKTNANSQGAIDTFKNLGSQLGGLFENYGLGGRAQINQAFDTQRNNTMGRLAARGWGGSNLSAVGDLGVERNRQLALGDFNDKILGQQIGAAQNTAQGLAGAYTNAGNQSQNLIGQMLGLMEGQANAGAASSSPGGTSYSMGGGGGSSGGGGGGGGGGGVAPGLPTGPGYFDQIADTALQKYKKKIDSFLGSDGKVWSNYVDQNGNKITLPGG